MRKLSRILQSTYLHPVLLAIVISSPLLSHAVEQQVWLEGGDYPIPGVLALPEQAQTVSASAAGSIPSVLLLHGTASQKNEVGDLFKNLARLLASQGIASLRIDFAGTGDSPVDYRQYSLSSARRDAIVALEFLANHSGLNDRTAVLGFSQGGLVAQRLAIVKPEIAALVTWSTAATNGTGSFGRFFDQHYEAAKRDGFASVDFPWLTEPLKFDLQWFNEVATHQTLKEVAAYTGPIFAIAGSSDSVVPYQQSAALVSQSSNSNSKFVLIDGADHIFNVLESDPPSANSARLLDETVTWIKGTLSN